MKSFSKASLTLGAAIAVGSALAAPSFARNARPGAPCKPVPTRTTPAPGNPCGAKSPSAAKNPCAPAKKPQAAKAPHPRGPKNPCAPKSPCSPRTR